VLSFDYYTDSTPIIKGGSLVYNIFDIDFKTSGLTFLSLYLATSNLNSLLYFNGNPTTLSLPTIGSGPSSILNEWVTFTITLGYGNNAEISIVSTKNVKWTAKASYTPLTYSASTKYRLYASQPNNVLVSSAKGSIKNFKGKYDKILILF